MPILIGSYAKEKETGLYLLGIDPDSNKLTLKNSLSVGINPSYLKIRNKFAFIVNEEFNKKRGGTVTVVDINSFSIVDRSSKIGVGPCYINIFGNKIITANYSGSSLSILQIEQNNRVTVLRELHYSGKKKHIRQEASHPHMVDFSPDKKYLFVTDLGLDKILQYPIKNGEIIETSAREYNSMHESGPRHFLFIGNLFLLANELSNTLSLYYYQNEKLEYKKNITIEGAPDFPALGAIVKHPSNKWIAVSIRVTNQIALFKLENDKITQKYSIQLRGETPRDCKFSPDGNFLIVALQNSNLISLYSFDSITGETCCIDSISIQAPSVIEFFEN